MTLEQEKQLEVTMSNYEEFKRDFGMYDCMNFSRDDRGVKCGWNEPPIDYFTCSLMEYSDYDNSCAVGRSNHRVFIGFCKKNNIPCEIVAYSYNGSAVELYKSDIDQLTDDQYQALYDFFAALMEYPCADDEDYSNMETEMIDEAWTRYGLSDAISAIKTPDTYSDDQWDELMDKIVDDKTVSGLLLDCYEEGNTVYIEGGGQVYFNNDAVADELQRVVLEYAEANKI